MWPSSRPSEECIIQTTNASFIEFSCLYPSLEATYFGWEKSSYLTYTPIYDWMCENTHVAYVAVVVYAILIYLGREFMKNRESFKWRYTMAGWNLFLSLYSGVTMVRVGLPLLHFLSTESLRDNLCWSPEIRYGRGSTGLWLFAFVWSKYFELFDTFFITIHKKPLIFLHWYHHITVLIFTWDSYVNKAPASVIYLSMNGAVHFIMYGYYFLMTMKWKPKWMSAIFITIAQITQMVIGLITAITTLYFYATENDDQNACEIKKSNVISAFLMYGSYLALFLQFFFQKYVFVKRKVN